MPGIKKMNNLSRFTLILVFVLNSCSSGKQTIDKPRSKGDYIFIDGKKVLIDSKTGDSIQYKTDSSYFKNKRIKREFINTIR